MNRPEEERALAPRWILRRPRLDPKTIQYTRSLKSLDIICSARWILGKASHSLTMARPTRFMSSEPKS